MEFMSGRGVIGGDTNENKKKIFFPGEWEGNKYNFMKIVKFYRVLMSRILEVCKASECTIDCTVIVLLKSLCC